jgi:hypothetical protein
MRATGKLTELIQQAKRSSTADSSDYESLQRICDFYPTVVLEQYLTLSRAELVFIQPSGGQKMNVKVFVLSAQKFLLKRNKLD